VRSDPVVRPLEDLGEYWPVDRIPVGGAPHAPDWQAVGFGAVWVSNRVLGVVHRISPASGRVRDIRVPPRPCNGLAAAFGSLWVPSCREGGVARISPHTGRTEAWIPVAVNSTGEGLIAAGHGGIWLTVENGRRLVRIDPVVNKIVASVALSSSSYGVAIGLGSVWVSNHGANTVSRVNPDTLHLVAAVPTGPSPLFLTVGSSSVWVINQGDGALARIDPKSNRVIASIPLSIPGEGGCIAMDNSAVWITMPGTPLIRIDAATNLETHRFVGAGGDCLSVGYGSVWLSNHEFGSVWRVRFTNG
jgi:virginiamycin B lyase